METKPNHSKGKTMIRKTVFICLIVALTFISAFAKIGRRVLWKRLRQKRRTLVKSFFWIFSRNMVEATVNCWSSSFMTMPSMQSSSMKISFFTEP